MKAIFSLLILMISTLVFANELKIEVTPNKPVAGEVFQAKFRIFTETDEEPVINFSPSNVEVVGKSNQGVATRTIYANGKLTVTREMIYVYDLVSSKVGRATLRDIHVNLGNKTIRHPLVSLDIVKEAETPSEVMIIADVPKTELFLGEGIVVRYYLYSRVPVTNLDIKTYPSLNKFLKRYLQEPERSERVSVDGIVYTRNLIYATKLFPEKTGELKIDAMNVATSYQEGGSNDPFSGFGNFGTRRIRNKNISSNVVNIIVKPLPEPVPKHFTGLVGKHDFTLRFDQSRLIVNQPLDVKFTVSGVGALENFEAPELIKNPGLEEFETNGEMKISDAESATKTFEYTFLAKNNLNLPARDYKLSYFDPETLKYVTTDLQIPEIVVAGGGEKPRQEAKKEKDKKETPKEEVKSQQDLSPVVTNISDSFKGWLPRINLAIACLALLISFGWFFKGRTFTRKSSKGIPANFKKGKFDLSVFLRWISPLITSSGQSPKAILQEASISDDAKKYFIEILNSEDSKLYSTRKTGGEYKYKAAFFKELNQYIESVTNESITKPK